MTLEAFPIYVEGILPKNMAGTLLAGLDHHRGVPRECG